MWRKSLLRIPPNLASVNCSIVAAHPWAFGIGQTEKSGSFLSPANAINALASRLAGVDSNQDVLILLITAKTLAEFITLLTAAAAVFPIPALTQVQRRAKAALSLDASKMQIPARPGGLPASVPLSVATTRMASGAQALQKAISDTAAGSSSEAIGTALAAFKQQRAALLTDAKNSLEQLQGASVPIWAFSVEGNTQTAIAEMKKDIPDSQAIFSLALLFVGEDLAPLRAMVVNHG
ncbi:TPA: hypothetical protein SJ425_000074 [Yersinia enterocolitica]|uniref:hypothetical protein n=1 Tax=Yersinia enterocolitica TaxID=630 RepID=UPI0021E7476A|nr:hypothetical protein [Yersinia enterocolitica]UYJ99783.1 hypothetical protein N4221_11140 [Yersinia enterocolitica]HEI6705257.1 hypothetical protein [Yersinia enterocolitica]HEI6706391.1 hypothetical protein [Yersinia enterocolitica]HEI6832308.1 hypothetical protein [Yersinia enterocolitica]